MKLSVIIPVYNVENYLADCIKSVLNQSFQDFELILVNDGSTDNSLQICNYYKELDTRIKVFNKENGGVSTARNLGLENSNGEWIYFVDADDSVNEGLFDIFFNELNCDIIQFGYHTMQADGNIVAKGPDINTVYSSADEFIVKSAFKTLTLWIHCIKSELIKQYNITFSEGIKYAEDLEFVIKCYGCASTIEVKSIIGYNYYIRDNSAMSQAYTFDNIKIHLDVANNLIDFYIQNNIKQSIFFQSRIEYMIKSYFSLSIKSKNIAAKEVLRYYRSYMHISKLKTSINNILIKYFPVLYYRLLMLVIKP